MPSKPKKIAKPKAKAVTVLAPEPKLPETIQWVEETRPLLSLTPFEQNPRTITKEQFTKLKQSLLEDGYHSRIKCTMDGRIVGGHQRLRALQELGYKDIKVLIPDRPLNDRQFVGILIRDNHSNGVFDMDMLSGMVDLEELRGFGLHDITGIAPEGSEDLSPPKNHVCCPKCGEQFPVKGNKA
jgi:hypothetical protein